MIGPQRRRYDAAWSHSAPRPHPACRQSYTQEFEVAANFFNLLDSSGHHQFTYSAANGVFSNNYAQLRSLQATRAFQLTVIFRF